jgi:TonB family protein
VNDLLLNCAPRRWKRVLLLVVAMFAFALMEQTHAQVRIAVLDFGSNPTGARAAERVRQTFVDQSNQVKEFVVIDSDLAMAAARGAGFEGSLNLTTQEARDIGAAIGCEFFFLGDAQTLRRVPSDGNAYFESFASVFLVSSRTGRLIFWDRPLERGDTAEAAEKALLQSLSAPDTRYRHQVLIRRAVEDERLQKEMAVGKPDSVIEIMSDDDNAGANKDLRAPRPLRRLKPPYPQAAARAEIEAVVDVLVDLDARGEVGTVEITRWAGYDLDQSVIDTVRQMHFFPAMREGVAIPTRVLLRYNFRKPPK